MILKEAKLFFVKNVFVKIVWTIGTVLLMMILAWYFYNAFYTGYSETTKGIVGTLLGAVVGGFFTLVGSIAVNKSSQKALNETKKKNLIYKPLYDELMVNHNIILEEPFPSYVYFENPPYKLYHSTQYTVWGRIKNDSRIFDVPSDIKKEMDALYSAIERYQECRENAIVELNQLYREAFKEIIDRENRAPQNVGECLLPEVLSGRKPDNDHLLWEFRQGTEDETYDTEADMLWNNIQVRVRNNEVLQLCIDTMNVWKDTEEQALKLLGFYIRYVSAKYEE